MTTATMSDAELESRLTATLRAVAEQTHVEGEPELLPYRTERGEPRAPNQRSRYLWLAVAAGLLVGVGTIGSLLLADRPGPDLDTIDQAADQARGARVSNGIEPEHIGADNVLYLLPPAGGQDARAYTGRSGSSVVAEFDRSSILVGRSTPEGFEELVSIFHSTSTGSFAIDDQSSETVAGRELFNSFDEGVAERLDDDSWVIYQTGFGNRLLADLVAGTSIVDGVLTFDSGQSDLKVLAGINNDTDESMTLSAGSGDDRAFEFNLQTRSAVDETEAMVLASGLGAPTLTPTTIADRPGYVFSAGGPDETVTIISWSPIEGHVAAVIVWGLDVDEATEFAEGLVAVDSDSWNEAVAG